MQKQNPTSGEMPQSKPDKRRKRTDGVRTLDDLKARCYVDDLSGCWLWQGAMSKGKNRPMGNPTTRVWLPPEVAQGQANVMTAGKAAWLLSGKATPDGYAVYRRMASCPHECIAPEHAACRPRVAMLKHIARDGRLRGKASRVGQAAISRARNAKPVEVVREVERLLAEGVSQRQICLRLGMGDDTVRAIQRGSHPHSAGRDKALHRHASIFSGALL